MFDKTKSSTMRIDLIPEISEVPLSAHPKQTIVVPKGGRSTVDQSASSNLKQGYQELFQSVYDAGFITDLRGRVRDVNRRAVDFFGYEPGDFRQLRVWDIVSGASEELVRTLAENLQNERFTLMQAYCIRKDESVFAAEIAVSQLRLAVPHLCFFVRDITLRRHTEEMLRTEHNAIQNASDAILVTSLNAHLEYANPATARIWGYPSPAELVGESLGRLLADPADAQRIIQSLTVETFEWKGQVRAVKANGETFPVHVRAACNRDSDGDVVGVVFSFSDLSAVERMENAARELERKHAILSEACQEAEELYERMKATFARASGEMSPEICESMQECILTLKRLQGILHTKTEAD